VWAFHFPVSRNNNNVFIQRFTKHSVTFRKAKKRLGKQSKYIYIISSVAIIIKSITNINLIWERVWKPQISITKIHRGEGTKNNWLETNIIARSSVLTRRQIWAEFHHLVKPTPNYQKFHAIQYLSKNQSFRRKPCIVHHSLGKVSTSIRAALGGNGPYVRLTLSSLVMRCVFSWIHQEL